jgi:hypothetical protein
VSEPTDTAPVTLAVIVIGCFGSGRDADLSGVLMAPTGEVLYQHTSSSEGWLVNDLSRNFGRTEKLGERYPQGWTVVVYNEQDPPDELMAAHRAFYAKGAANG